MSPNWLIGFIVLFLICSMVSSVIEEQDLIASGSTEKSAMDKLFSFTQIDVTDMLGSPGTFLQTMGETIDGIWTMLRGDYSFTRSTPEDPNTLGVIWQYFMWAVSIGILISFAIVIGQMIRGS